MNVQNHTTIFGYFPGVTVDQGILGKKKTMAQRDRTPLGTRLNSYLFITLLVAIGIHGWHDVDSCLINKMFYLWIPALVHLTEVWDKNQEDFATYDLITMHVANVLELRLTCV